MYILYRFSPFLFFMAVSYRPQSAHNEGLLTANDKAILIDPKP